MNNRIVLVGGGGHCKSVLNSICRQGLYTDIYITDPNLEPGSDIMGAKVAGDDSVLPLLLSDGVTNAFVTIGSLRSAELRKKKAEELKSIGFILPTIIDPSAIVADNVKVGNGIFIGMNALINADAQIGDFSIINSGAIIEHEGIVGSFSHISVGAILCGKVHVGDNVLIGAGTTVIQGITIGNNTVIGAGSLVNSDIPQNSTAYGIPARVR